LARLKKDKAQIDGTFVLLDAEPLVQAAWVHPDEGLYGVFNVGAATGDVAVRIPDGTYTDLLSDHPVEVNCGRMRSPESAAILAFRTEIENRPFHSDLLDH
jgi:hypothetical protein